MPYLGHQSQEGSDSQPEAPQERWALRLLHKPTALGAHPERDPHHPELLFSSGLAFRAPPPYSPFFSLMFLFFVKLACSFAVATCPRLQFSAVCKSVLLVK